WVFKRFGCSNSC
ncbi:hypothetical protein CFC21_041700, partial [Triticum aestivum]